MAADLPSGWCSGAEASDSLLEIDKPMLSSSFPALEARATLLRVNVFRKSSEAGKSTFIVGVNPKEMEQP